VTQARLRDEDRSEGGIAGLGLDRWEAWVDAAGLHSFEPADRALVALAADLGAHLLRLRSREVVEGSVDDNHHEESVAVGTGSGEDTVHVVDGTEIAGDLLDGL
jgi:hypothetical protein